MFQSFTKTHTTHPELHLLGPAQLKAKVMVGTFILLPTLFSLWSSTFLLWLIKHNLSCCCAAKLLCKDNYRKTKCCIVDVNTHIFHK